MISERISALIHEQLSSAGISVDPVIASDSRLVDLGLDSLGFAIIVARLEEETGRDPFGPGQGNAFPTTVGELIALYDQG